MKKWVINSIILLAPLLVQAQKNNYHSRVNNADSSGFYKILLAPAILSEASLMYNDIRLVDQNNKQVPYLLETEKEFVISREFHDFPITPIQRSVDSLSYYIIKNSFQKTVDELIFHIANTQANRSFSISGSNDSLQWFAIKENIQVKNKDEGRSYFIQQIVLPQTSYTFYKIVVNGKNLSPFNLIKSGIYETRTGAGTYHELKDLSIVTNIANGLTKIDLSLNGNHVVDQIKFSISEPKYFNRRINVYDPENSNAYLGGYTLSSGTENIVPLHFKGGKIRIEVEDRDDPVLTIENIQAFQLNRYLLAYLEKGNDYSITFGDANAKAPQYDLSYFSDSISANSVLLRTNAIERIASEDIKTTDNNKWLLWIVIVVVLIILLVVTRKMAREINNKKNNK